MGPTVAKIPTRVTVIRGDADVADKVLLALAAQEEAPRWAVLTAADDGPGRTRGMRSEGGSGLVRMPLPGGCPCCAGAVALRTAMIHVLARGPWGRIVLLPTLQADLVRLADNLRSPVLESHLWLADLIVAGSIAMGAEGTLAGAGAYYRSAHEALKAWPPADPFDWQLDLQARIEGLSLARRRLCPPPAVQVPVDARCRIDRIWPGELRFDRRALVNRLAALDMDAAVAGIAFAGRTAREWYHWASVDRTMGGGLTETVVDWRQDSRLSVWLVAPEDRPRIEAAIDLAVSPQRLASDSTLIGAGGTPIGTC